LPQPISTKSIDVGRNKVVLACLLASLVLAGCQRHAAPVADPASSAEVPATGAAPVDDTATPSASLAGVEHDADPDPASLRDPFVLPGPLSAATGPDGLRRIYGAQNVVEADVPGAEGEKFHGVILFPKDAARIAYVYFQDEKTLTGLSLVRVFGPVSRWQLDNGIGIGTPLSEVLRRNGKPIRFYGLDWDYGGTITEWNGGRLAPRDDDPVRRAIHLGAREGAAARSYPMGDREFSSDDPRYPQLGENVVVNEIGVSFPGEDDL
jgi:hypothetical protein